MDRFTKDLKEALDEISEIQPMITVKRSSLENLITAYEKNKDQADEYQADYYFMNVREYAKLNKINIVNAAFEINRSFSELNQKLKDGGKMT